MACADGNYKLVEMLLVPPHTCTTLAARTICIISVKPFLQSHQRQSVLSSDQQKAAVSSYHCSPEHRLMLCTTTHQSHHTHPLITRGTTQEMGADKNCHNRWGITPLAEAIAHRQTLVAGLLSQWKAKLNTSQAAGQLCETAAAGDLEAVRRLVENNVDPNVGDYDGRCAMHVAAAEGQDKVRGWRMLLVL